MHSVRFAIVRHRRQQWPDDRGNRRQPPYQQDVSRYRASADRARRIQEEKTPLAACAAAREVEDGLSRRAKAPGSPIPTFAPHTSPWRLPKISRGVELLQAGSGQHLDYARCPSLTASASARRHWLLPAPREDPPWRGSRRRRGALQG